MRRERDSWLFGNAHPYGRADPDSLAVRMMFWWIIVYGIYVMFRLIFR